MRHLFKTLLPQLSNQLLFRWQQLKYSGSNKRFKQQHPDLPLPNAYMLYESYNLNYKKYMEDGKLTASEILNTVKKHLPTAPQILDWGCGPARITRHIQGLLPNAQVYGTDTNADTIAWNELHFNSISFVPQKQTPPLPFTDQQFDLIIGFSVLTHIPANMQEKWMNELYRILKPGGIIWLTTHGQYYIQKLSNHTKQAITNQGIYNTPYPQSGHRMMSTYHDPAYFKKILAEKFELLSFFDGENFPAKAGRQDLWVGRKMADRRCQISDVGFLNFDF